MVAAVFDPSGVAVRPDGRSAYVTNFAADSISQYDVDAGGRLSPKSPATVSAPLQPDQDRGCTQAAKARTSPRRHGLEFFFGVLQYNVRAGGTLSPKSPSRSPPGSGESGAWR